MVSYLLHRMTGALLVIFGVTAIVFLLIHLIPVRLLPMCVLNH